MTDTEKSVREQIGMSHDEFIEMGRIGAIFYEQGNFEKAVTIFEGLVELDPESGDARAALGGVYTQLERDDEAIEQLTKAIELKPEEIAPHANLGEIYLRKGRLDEAVAEFGRAIELDPEEENPSANRARAIVLGLKEAFEEAGVLKDGQVNQAAINEATSRAVQPIKEADGTM